MKAILFDLDGVLIDTSSSYDEALRRTLQELAGILVSPSQIRKFRQIPGFNDDWDLSYAILTNRFKPLNMQQRNTPLYKEISKLFQKFYLGGLMKNERLLVSQSILSRLSRFPLGVVTGRNRRETAFALKSISKFFRTIITSDDCRKKKPDPEPIKLALRKLNADSAVYVGDTINDALAAKRAGCEFIQVGDGERIKGAKRIRDVNDLPEAIENEKG